MVMVNVGGNYLCSLDLETVARSLMDLVHKLLDIGILKVIVCQFLHHCENAMRQISRYDSITKYNQAMNTVNDCIRHRF